MFKPDVCSIRVYPKSNGRVSCLCRFTFSCSTA
nr:MAG TPA: hypothetical protein [Caudoviricetes sp.]